VPKDIFKSWIETERVNKRMCTNLVSVVIPTYNYGEFLHTAITSVLNQTYSKVELLVIDDGSTDNTKEILNSFAGHIRSFYQPNSGQSVARNLGILYSRGSAIAFLDADDYWEPTKLEKQMAILNEKKGAIYCSLISEGTDETNLIEAKTRGSCLSEFYRRPGVQLITGGESTLVVEKQIISRAGLFNPKLSICAGYDFYRRIAMYTEFDFVSEPLVHYRRHSANISLNKNRYRNELRMIQKDLRSEVPWKVYSKYLITNEFNLVKDKLRSII
jgi:glycosyltransferase involved in cell wall biosynthesis